MALLGKGVEHAPILYYVQAHRARMRSPLLLTTFNIIIKLHLKKFNLSFIATLILYFDCCTHLYSYRIHWIKADCA